MRTIRDLLRRLWAWLDKPPRRPDTYRAGDADEKPPWRPGDDFSDHA